MFHVTWPQPPQRTGPAFVGEMMWVSPLQCTAFGDEDEETMLVRLLCHRVVEILPREANEELLRTMVDLFKFYGRPSAPEVPPPGPVRRAAGKVSKSVRPGITFDDEG